MKLCRGFGDVCTHAFAQVFSDRNGPRRGGVVARATPARPRLIGWTCEVSASERPRGAAWAVRAELHGRAGRRRGICRGTPQYFGDRIRVPASLAELIARDVEVIWTGNMHARGKGRRRPYPHRLLVDDAVGRGLVAPWRRRNRNANIPQFVEVQAKRTSC